MNKEEIAKKAHKTAKSKGFWDIKPNFNTQLMLIISEMAEAIEADRKGRYADLTEYNRRYNEVLKTLNPNMDTDTRYLYASEIKKDLFLRLVKDSFEDEIADAILRTMDLMVGYEIDIREDIPNIHYAVNSLHQIETNSEALLYITSIVIDCYKSILSGNDENLRNSLNILLELLITFCKIKDIPYDSHLLAKLEYNDTRPRLHGKSY